MDREAWAWAADWVEAYRHQVAVTDGSAIGSRPASPIDRARYDEVTQVVRAYARDHHPQPSQPCGASGRR